jgi:hypothetical protein
MDESPKPKRNAPLWVKIFVPFHIVAITAWSLPYAPREFRGPKPAKALTIRTDSIPGFFQSTAQYLDYGLLLNNERYLKDSPLRFYVLSTGFWQYWDMFSPNPSSVDTYADAVVHFKDGTSKVWQYPRMFTLSIGQKFLKERWRKFFERAGAGNYRYMWPTFAQRVAEWNYTDPENPPVVVDLHRHEMVINPPGEPENTAYSDQMYWTQRIDQAELHRNTGK